MTNVPGAGFVALLGAAAVALALPLLAGVGLLVAKLTGRRLLPTLLAVHALAVVVGIASLWSGTNPGTPDLSLAAAFGLARFTLGGILVGLLVALVFEGGPIALGALATVLLRETGSARAVWCATTGYAAGGIGGALAGLLLTGNVLGAVLGALLAVPGALFGVVVDATATRFDRSGSVA
ncbi:hypothetical protein [Halobellus sp. EA9]|uniref:hypothetical protein n=1 Tax=Halobellus sp. EA9 TaxID=3421647 RepID=UPI003EBF3F30